MRIATLFTESLGRFSSGLSMTIKLTFISLIFASILGLIFGLMTVSKSKAMRGLATIYIDLIRGTPLLVQAFFIYFGIPPLLNIRLTAEFGGIVTLSLNAGAYIAEIFRGGIQAINVGQMEAARSLGLPYSRAMAKVILPQAIRVMIPMLINQFIITLKDTSILSAIGLPELTQTGKIIIAANFESTRIWAIVALFYLVPITILSKVSKYIEGRLDYGKSKNPIPKKELS